MANRPGGISAPNRGQVRPLSIVPRRGARSSETSALAGLVAELKSLSVRSGGALASAYVAAARSFLERVEQFEDSAAERKFRHRAPSRSSEPSTSAK